MRFISRAKRSARTLFSALFLPLFLLSGCGEPAVVQPTTASSEPVNAAIQRGSKVIVSIGSIPETIDPIYSDSEVSRWVLALTTLSAFDLIQSHREADYGREHAIRIAPRTFHNGQQVRLEDVKYGYDRIRDEGYRGIYREFADKLVSVEIVGDELVFRFDRAVRIEDEGFCLPVAQQFSVESGEMLGCGSYELTAIAEDHLVLDRRPSLPDELDPLVERIEFVDLLYPEAKAALEDGRIDLIRLPRDRAEANWARKTPFVQLAVREGRSMYYIGFGPAMMKLPSGLRRAIEKSIDVEAFLQEAFSGYAIDMPYPIVSARERGIVRAFTPERGHNAEEAKKNLAENGWMVGESGYLERQGEILTIRYCAFVDVDWSYLLATHVERALGALAIRTEIQYLDYNTLMLMLESGAGPDMWGFAWEIPPFGTPEVLFSSDGAGIYNFGGFANDRAEQIFQLLYQTDLAEQDALYETWYTIADREKPVIPLALSQDLWAANDRIRLSELPWIRLHR